MAAKIALTCFFFRSEPLASSPVSHATRTENTPPAALSGKQRAAAKTCFACAQHYDTTPTRTSITPPFCSAAALCERAKTSKNISNTKSRRFPLPKISAPFGEREREQQTANRWVGVFYLRFSAVVVVFLFERECQANERTELNGTERQANSTPPGRLSATQTNSRTHTQTSAIFLPQPLTFAFGCATLQNVCARTRER